MLNGTLELGATVNAPNECLDCPFGGECSGGGDAVNATAGYWGSLAADGGNITFTLCPSGLCCLDGGCAWNETCAPLRRDNNVPLCGACEAGFSATVGSSACRATGDCDDAGWFVPGLLALALAWTQFVLFAGALSSSSSSGGGGGGGAPSALSQVAEAAQLVLYFYQMAPLLPVGQTQIGEALAVVAGLFNMQLQAPSADGSACPFPGLTPLQVLHRTVISFSAFY